VENSRFLEASYNSQKLKKEIIKTIILYNKEKWQSQGLFLYSSTSRFLDWKRKTPTRTRPIV